MRRRKIIWLVIWLTLGYWLGGAWGCARSAQVVPGAVPGSQAGAPAERLAQVESPTASLAANTLDRKHWPVVEVTAAADQSRAARVYLRDCPIAAPASDAPAPWLSKQGVPDVEWRLQESLAGSRANGWDRANAIAAGAQPLKFAADVALLPVRAAGLPPTD